MCSATAGGGGRPSAKKRRTCRASDDGRGGFRTGDLASGARRRQRQIGSYAGNARCGSNAWSSLCRRIRGDRRRFGHQCPIRALLGERPTAPGPWWSASGVVGGRELGRCNRGSRCPRGTAARGGDRADDERDRHGLGGPATRRASEDPHGLIDREEVLSLIPVDHETPRPSVSRVPRGERRGGHPPALWFPRPRVRAGSRVVSVAYLGRIWPQATGSSASSETLRPALFGSGS